MIIEYDIDLYGTKSLKKITNKYLKKLPEDVTTIVSTGSSGCSIATSLLLKSKRELKHSYIRKPCYRSHSCRTRNISNNDIVAIADDFIQSGGTIKRILNMLKNLNGNFKIKYIMVNDINYGNNEDYFRKLYRKKGIELIIVK